MALTNFTLPFGALAQSVQSWGATIAPLHAPSHRLATNTNNLLYSPADHQQQQQDDGPTAENEYYKNNPYATPQMHKQQQQQQQQAYHYHNGNSRRKAGNTYLPPVPTVNRNTQQQQQQQQYHQQQFSHYSANKQQQQQQQQHHQQQQQQQISSNNVVYKASTSAASAASSSATATRTYGEGTYTRFPATSGPTAVQQQQQQQVQQKQYYNSFSATQTSRTSAAFHAQQQQLQLNNNNNNNQQLPHLTQNYGASVETPAATYGSAGGIPAQTQPSAVSSTSSAASSASLSSTKTTSSSSSSSLSASQQSTLDGVEALASTGNSNDGYPDRPPGFTRVQAGQGSRTQVHAVLDYDAEEGEEDYYDESDHGEPIDQDGSSKKSSSMPTVTPIQGPIFLKNGTVPVVPLFSYPQYNNGTFVQIPIWWTALSVALGLDVRGDVIKGVPCIKRYHQLFCPTAGNSYPIEKIERFIDDNKALMRRMYGDFEMNMDDGGPRQQTKRKRRFIDEPDIFIPPGAFPATIPDDQVAPHAEEAGESYFGKLRNKRQAQNRNSNRSGGGASTTPNFSQNGQGNTGPTGRLDACESKVEIVTPYWASNSAGKIRAIVNTQHFEQAIHQEICSKTQTPRCERDCGCEQKYKWHRLLAYDPDNDCKGIFMDWFLFPSCCVCRCNP